MNILVTGADGQLGRSLGRISGEFPSYNFIFTDLPEADITDPDTMRSLVARHGADVIVNFAAYTTVDRAEHMPLVASRVNTFGPHVLAGIAGEAGIPLVHISTDFVFDGRASRPYGERDAAEPLNEYGRTKLEGEKEIIGAGIDAVIIRTSWLYSEFGTNFVKTILRLAEERDSIDVVDDQVGSPTYAEGLARAVMVLIGRGVKGTQIYHYCDSGEVSRYEFAVEITKMAGKNVIINPVSTGSFKSAAKRPGYSVLDTTKIKNAGVEVADWRERLARCVERLG